MSHDEHSLPPYFHEIFDASLPRLGVGSDRSTLEALERLQAAGLKIDGPEKLRVLDVGCGNGPQTVQLARELNGTILAVDIHRPFLEELKRRAREAGVEDRIEPCLKDMRNMELEESSFDLVWSEGAFFVMGFQNALEMCFSLLVPGGMAAASELAWLRPDTPDECREFFEKIYPPMMDIDGNLATIRNCGYEVVGHFVLPDADWWEPLYHPLEKRIQTLRQKDAQDPEKAMLLDTISEEIEIFRAYSKYYGTVFFLMKKPGG